MTLDHSGNHQLFDFDRQEKPKKISISERSQLWLINKERKLNQKRYVREQREVEGCTFEPNLVNYSRTSAANSKRTLPPRPIPDASKQKIASVTLTGQRSSSRNQKTASYRSGSYNKQQCSYSQIHLQKKVTGRSNQRTPTNYERAARDYNNFEFPVEDSQMFRGQSLDKLELLEQMQENNNDLNMPHEVLNTDAILESGVPNDINLMQRNESGNAEFFSFNSKLQQSRQQ